MILSLESSLQIIVISLDTLLFVQFLADVLDYRSEFPVFINDYLELDLQLVDADVLHCLLDLLVLILQLELLLPQLSYNALIAFSGFRLDLGHY